MEQKGKLLLLGLLLLVLGFASYRTFFWKPAPPVDPTACRYGTVPCPNNCLKREADGWTTMHVEGHPDTDIWMRFVDERGKRVAFNQHHIGHVITPVNGKYTDVGVCPVCKGRTVVCR